MALSVPLEDGATLRTHLQRLRANTGSTDPRLQAAATPLPPTVATLWSAFVALSGTRMPVADGGMAPITFGEIEAWQRLTGVRLTPWEVETLLAVDRAARSAAHQSRRAP